jgi:hypothetical protein
MPRTERVEREEERERLAGAVALEDLPADFQEAMTASAALLPQRAAQATPEEILLAGIKREIAGIEAVGITADLVTRMALEGLACIRYHALRGNLKAAMYLVNRCMGQPSRPYAEEVRTWTEAQLQDALLLELDRLRLPVAVRQLLISRLTEGAVEEAARTIVPALGPGGVVLPDLEELEAAEALAAAVAGGAAEAAAGVAD